MDFNNGPKLTKSRPKKLINWTKKINQKQKWTRNYGTFWAKIDQK